MNEELYVRPAVYTGFEKSASETTLPEDTNAWPNEIMQELFKQVPYVSDFDPNVVMDRVDAERGYAFGHVEVQNKTELQQGASPEALQAVGVQSARIPIIIKDRKLQPLDVIVTSSSKTVPLTERRMREVLFRPQAFDVTSRTPGDMSMVGQLYPPYRQNYGMGGGGGVGMSVGMGKEGSALEQFLEKEALSLGEAVNPKTGIRGALNPANWPGGMNRGYSVTGPVKGTEKKTAAANVPNSTTPTPKGPTVRDLMPKVKIGSSIIGAVLSTIDNDDIVKFAEALTDNNLRSSFMKNAAAIEVIKQLADQKPFTSTKMAAAIGENLQPTVIQVTKLAQGYRLKAANHNFWRPVEDVVDRGFVVRHLGEKVALAADTTGSITLTDTGINEGEEQTSSPELISNSGTYKVKDSQGQELLGIVFPNLLDCDGTSLPIALFTNGSVTALQSAIAGELTSPDAGLLFGPVKGHGCFVRKSSEDGHYEAMIPMTIQAGFSSGGENKQHVETYDGRQLFVAVQPNIQQPTMVDDTCLVPDSFKWMPLGGGSVDLVSHPEDWGKSKEASRAYASVAVRAHDDTFSFSGLPLEKFASDEKSFLDIDDALFLLAGFGTDLDYASQKIASSILHGRPEQIRIGRSIKLASSLEEDSIKEASAFLSSFPDLRVSLIKEAAFIPDPLAVDTVLSVGFINPENIMTFVSYLPQLDESQSKLCELLVASRLGLSDVPTSPLEKAIKSLEDVLEGLRVLAFQKS